MYFLIASGDYHPDNDMRIMGLKITLSRRPRYLCIVAKQPRKRRMILPPGFVGPVRSLDTPQDTPQEYLFHIRG